MKEIFNLVSYEWGNSFIISNFLTRVTYIEIRDINPLFVMNILVLILLGLIIWFIWLLQNSLIKSDRINDTPANKKRKKDTLLQSVFREYHIIVNVFTILFGDSVLLNRISKKYKKYIGIVNNVYSSSLEFVINKFIFAFIILVFTIVMMTLFGKLPSTSFLFILALLAFFLPNVYYEYKYFKHKN